MNNFPNLHPLVIHFPIALYSVVVLMEAIRIFLKKKWINTSAIFILVISTLGAAAAYITGMIAADGMVLTSDQIPAVARHSDLALITVILLSLYLLLRIIILKWSNPGRTLIRLTLFLFSLIPFFWIVRTADAGGALVYRNNVGRIKSARVKIKELNKQVNRGKEMLSLRKNGFNNQGIWSWNGESDPNILFSSVFGLKNHPEIAIREGNDEDGISPLELGIKFNIKSLFLFPDFVKNPEIEMIIDLSQFQGQFSLLHHYSTINHSGDFIRFEEKKVLFDRYEGTSGRIIASRKIKTRRKLKLKISVYQKHIRLYIDEKLIFHKHQLPLDGNRTGFSIDGSGVVKIYNFRIKKYKK